MRTRCLLALVLLWLSATSLWAADTGDPMLFTGPDALNMGVGKLTVNNVPVDPTVAHTGYAPVRMATTANLTLSGVQTIDGIGGAVNDRVLVKNQTTGSENGIYVMQSGAWTRATDMDTSAELAPYRIAVREGTTQEGTVWVLTTLGNLTLGTSPLTFGLDTAVCGVPGGPVCSDEATGEIPGLAMAYPDAYVTTPPTCGDGKEWRYDTAQTGKYRLAVCVGGEGENPLTAPFVSTLDQVCVDGGDCETCPAGQDCTLNVITGTNVTASVSRTGNTIEVTVNSGGLSFAGEAQGDLAVRGASVWQRFAKGTTGQLLSSGASTLAWTTITTSQVYAYACTDDAGAGSGDYFLQHIAAINGGDCNATNSMNGNRQVVPRAGTAVFYCKTDVTPSTGSVVLTLYKNDATTGASCTINSGGSTTCNNTSTLPSVAVGDDLALNYNPSADITLNISCTVEVRQ